MRKWAMVILLLAGVLVCVFFMLSNRDPAVLWEKSMSVDWVFHPVIGDQGMIYVGDLKSNLCAVTRDGSLRWKTLKPRTAIGPFDAAAIGPQTIYTIARSGELVAFNTNGGVRWLADIDVPYLSTAAIGRDNTLYVASKSNKLHAFNADGSQRWEFNTGKERPGAAAIGLAGTIYFAARTNLLALNPDGTLKWTCTNAGLFSSYPIVGPDETIYVQASTNFCAISPEGIIKWSVPNRAEQHSAILDSSGTLYVCGDNGLKALEAATGKELWRYVKPLMPFSGLALASDRTIYFSGLDSSIHGIDRDGKLKWSFSREPLPGAIGSLSRMVNWLFNRGKPRKGPHVGSFTLAEDDRLYAIMPDRKLYALKVPAGLDTNAPWPMFRQNVRHTGRGQK